MSTSTRCIALALLYLVPVVAAGTRCPGEYSYTIIADTAGPFTSFARKPSISPGGRVAFVAELDDGGSGIFVGNGRSDPIPVVLDQDADPDSDFVQFGDPAIAGIAGAPRETRVAYWAETIRDGEPLPPSGIYRSDGLSKPVTIAIALTQHADPDSTHGSLGREPGARADGDVVFSAIHRNGTPSAVFRGPGDVVLAESGSGYHGLSRPTTACHFDCFYAYEASEAGNDAAAIFRGNTTGNVLVRTSDPLVDFISRPVVSGNGHVVYLYHHSANPPPAPLEVRVLRWQQSSGDSVIADSQVHGLRNLHLSELAVNASGCVVFDAFQEGVVPEGRRLFIGDGSGFQPVMVRFELLAGGFIADYEFGRYAVNNGGQVAIWLRLGLGAGQKDRELIVRADPNVIFYSGFRSAGP